MATAAFVEKRSETPMLAGAGVGGLCAACSFARSQPSVYGRSSHGFCAISDAGSNVPISWP